VLARPGDAELRRVTGDALLEAGHPWGELIALQFAVAERRASTPIRQRIAELLKQHVAVFAGPIATVASTLPRKQCLVFDRGCLDKVRLDRRLVPRAHWEAAAAAPHWATVSELDLSVLTTPHWWIAAWARNPAATRSLRRLAMTAIVLERGDPSAAWTVVKSSSRSVYANMLGAFASGLPAAERARIAFAAKIPKNHRPGLEEALARG